MNSLLRSIALTPVMALIVPLLLSAQPTPQTADDLLSKGREMFKNYKPPAPTHLPPSETPAQAWRNATKQHLQRQIVSPTPAELEQRKLGEELRASYERRQQQQREIEQKISAAKSSPPRDFNSLLEDFRGRGIAARPRVSPEAAITEGSAFVKEDQAKRGLTRNSAPSLDEIRKAIESEISTNPTRPAPALLSVSTTVDTGVGRFNGIVWHDLNRNGAIDENEPPLAGHPVYLSHYYGGQTDTDTTDELGMYRFHNLEDNNYFYPYMVTPEGWINTFTSSTYYYLNPGDSALNKHFGFWKIQPSMFSGVKWHDLNHNGVKDEGEPGLPGWSIHLRTYNSGKSFTEVTDENGSYAFDSLYFYNEYYMISESDQAGWMQTQAPNNGWIFVDSDTLENYDFGNWLVPPMMITGTKYNDMNGNGQRDEGEPGLEGWTITAYHQQSGHSVSAVTDVEGSYTIRDSGYFGDYLVYEESQDGWFQTQPWNGDDEGYYLTFIAGDTTNGLDFGNWAHPPGAIAGMKYRDDNQNGQWDEGELPMDDWKIYLKNESTGQIDSMETDSLGQYWFGPLDDASYYVIWEEEVIDWVQTEPGGDSWRFFIVGDTVTANFGNWLPDLGPLRVNTMPSNAVSVAYANALAGVPLAVWGNAHGGVPPLRYTLDYGDGTVETGEVTDRRFIGSDHSYATAGPKTMILTVIDDEGNSDTDQSVIRVYAAPSQQIRINMAIEKGLLFNYLNQYPNGSWYDGYGGIASTGTSALAMEENGHLPTNDINTDIYAEYVRMALDYLLSQAKTYSISVQSAGDPDSDGDGTGAYFYDGENYANGIGLLAIVGAHRSGTSAASDTIRTGPYAGQTFFDFMVDALDQIAFSQTEGYGRGGWRYSVATSNYGSSDNSAAQWPALVLEAAQNSWGMAIPQFVKDELLQWLQYSQGTSGGFGYTDANYWDNFAKTGAGIGAYAALDSSSASTPVVNALTFLNNYWGSAYDGFGVPEHMNGNLYGMYAIAKGLRIIDNRVGLVNVGAHNWFDEYSTYLLDHTSYGQRPNGSWTDAYWIGSTYTSLSTSFAILVLTQGVIVPPPVAIIAPIDRKPPSTPFTVDGSGSFHQDPNKSIIEWLWDWDASDGVDWNNPDASGQVPTNPGYANVDTFTITLRVKDDSDPALYDIETRNVEISTGNTPPVAVPIPPERGPSYAARVGEPIFLDGRASYDPDAPEDSVVGYNWDLNGDGIFGDLFTDTVTVVFENEHQGQVGLRVYDSRGDSSSNVAFINIVTSRKDIFVAEFRVDPTQVIYGAGGTIDFFAVFRNDANSNTDVPNALVRFYDENPFTIGNRIGVDFNVSLPVGVSDTVMFSAAVPAGFMPGVRSLYVLLDPTGQIAEWDEQNNLASVRFEVVVPPPHMLIDRSCLSFATVPLGQSKSLALNIGNDGEGTLFVDSVGFSHEAFSLSSEGRFQLGPGEKATMWVTFMPEEQGVHEASMTLYTNDGERSLELFGHGELEAGGEGQQIFSGLVTLEGMIAHRGTTVGAFTAGGELIAATIVEVHQDSVVDQINYDLSILEGQAGVAAGDTIYFRILTPACAGLRDMICDDITVFTPAFPPPGGFTRRDINAVHPRTVSIPLMPRYNSVSWNVRPHDQHIASVFRGLIDSRKLKIVLSYMNDGEGVPQFTYYIPALGRYNPLQWTHFTQGYFVHLFSDVEPDSLVVEGLPVCPDFGIHLNSGFNLLSYLPTHSDSVTHALSSLTPGNLIAAYDFRNDGTNQYFDFYPLGAFQVMWPEKGYFVKVQHPDVLRYPSSAPSSGKNIPSAPATRTSLAAGSPVPLVMFAYGTDIAIAGVPVREGTEVKAIDSDGIVCGSSKFLADGIFALGIAGDDPATPADEGASVREPVRLYINNQPVDDRIVWTEFGDVAEVKGTLVVTDAGSGSILPQAFALQRNYPNPFNPVTSIRFELPRAARVSITVYDMLGREVRTLIDDDSPAGYHQVQWDGTTDRGLPASSGMYTYRMTANDGESAFVATHKMMLLK